MLFVIATKLNVFLQLTPEMQTHLPQPLNRISIGIILGTQDGRDWTGWDGMGWYRDGWRDADY